MILIDNRNTIGRRNRKNRYRDFIQQYHLSELSGILITLDDYIGNIVYGSEYGKLMRLNSDNR